MNMTREPFQPSKYLAGVLAVAHGEKKPCDTLLHYHAQYQTSDDVKQRVRGCLAHSNPHSGKIGAVIEGIGHLNAALERRKYSA